jgi:hypothetical protein
MLRSKVTLAVVYFSRACSCASGFASTPIHRRGGAPQHGRPVALAARQVDHPPAVRARRDPLVDDEVPLVPVVLLGDVGQRPLAGERERRHAVGLVALEVEAGLLHGAAHLIGAPGSAAAHRAVALHRPLALALVITMGSG